MTHVLLWACTSASPLGKLLGFGILHYIYGKTFIARVIRRSETADPSIVLRVVLNTESQRSSKFKCCTHKVPSTLKTIKSFVVSPTNAIPRIMECAAIWVDHRTRSSPLPLCIFHIVMTPSRVPATKHASPVIAEAGSQANTVTS